MVICFDEADIADLFKDPAMSYDIREPKFSDSNKEGYNLANQMPVCRTKSSDPGNDRISNFIFICLYTIFENIIALIILIEEEEEEKG